MLAETRAQAQDAAEMVVVDYDPLPAVVDPLAALEPDAPLLFSRSGSNVAVSTTTRATRTPWRAPRSS